MLVLKIWGSVFAPKNKNVFDTLYLESLKNILLKKDFGKIVLLHGTGSFGHNFVLKHGISEETFYDFLIYSTDFFSRVDAVFQEFLRVPGEDILSSDYTIDRIGENIISWWDAFVETYEVLSSDDLFSKMMSLNRENKNIILTDVNWVYDKNNKLITQLSLKDIDSLDFWNKEWDVTNWMKWKLLALKDGLVSAESWVWICNWFNLDNFTKILETWKWIWTYITL